MEIILDIKMGENQMFCYQCEQTAKGTGCTTMGVCGKNPEVATLQDLLIYTLRGISQLSLKAAKIGVEKEGFHNYPLKLRKSELKMKKLTCLFVKHYFLH
jgi:hydroxylamine reductase